MSDQPEHPHDRPADGVDRESEKWWDELTRLDAAEGSGTRRPPRPARAPRGSQGLGSTRRRARRRRRRGDPAYGGGRTSRTSRALLAFLALLVAAGGVISFVERGWEQTRIATLDAGGGVDTAKVIQGEDGEYAFIRTQRGGQDPVTYPPCRAIGVQVNPDGEVEGGSQVVLDSMARVSDLAGVELRYSGLSSERPAAREQRLRSEGYQGDPPPLIAWSDAEETPALAGDVVGVGGSVALRRAGDSQEFYATGSVVLDAPDLARVLDEHGDDAVQAVVMHELGHLLGLGHVGDPEELMAPSNTGQTDFGDGDREGLARLGEASC